MSQMPYAPPAAEQADVLIRASGLTKQFDDQIAVNNVSFNIPQGAIFGFIGPSGCGKTTTVRLLTGMYLPTAGEASVLGSDPRYFTRRDRERIGYMPQQSVLYPDLTVKENLNFAASIYGLGPFSRKKHLDRLLEFVELSDHKGKLARKISGGMMRRLSLASALVHRPSLIFLDEPTAGVDPVLRRKFWDYFDRLRQEHATLFVTTQYVSESAYCDLVGVMDQGRLLVVDTPDGLRKIAHGGELVDMRTVEIIDYPSLQMLRTLPFVTGPVHMLDDQTARLTVDEASTAMPALLEWCKARNLTIESIQEFQPPFDDTFVNLIHRYKTDE